MYLLEKFKARSVRLFSRELISCNFSDSAQTDPVYQVVFDAGESGLSYKVGDALGIFSQNSPNVVHNVLDALGYASQEQVESRHSACPLTAEQLFTSYLDVDKFPAKLKSYFPKTDDTYSFYDAIREFKPRIPLKDLVQIASPLLPRFYSIASSPSVMKDKIELLVRLVSYSGKFDTRYGVCSYFLCNELAKGSCCPVFVQPTKYFTLGEKTVGKPIVMIGSGTGVAPYKGFLQQRLHDNDTGRNVLFFGERFEKANFYYRSFWEKLEEQNKLQLFSAFSRDGNKKTYVQDIVREQEQLISELYDGGAYFFICGSKDLGVGVKKTLEDILGKDALSTMKEERRYLVDVY
ncbi:oxidoreductase NAD-binding domain protein [Chlamydia ibidis]|uniref:Oxidoreductase NAD-binding domain protein n=2 Tax=Chlamydia ibidis TaxID=1405396 RepID=S7KGZ9_9CHLA|nr:sulfite reductase flavoprotein subunit alpha [Chlamydia ibidis]EPP35456.1 oxidoreductase NAD-binding domain protein [Chlamydia ibidis]EQM62898.1 oxidoreductase NAD-binding domain protein [Chlamydia ibidis 10-1398/6]